MAVMISDDKKDMVITCKCGCEDAIHVQIVDIWDGEDIGSDYTYGMVTYLNGNFYRDQDNGVLRTIGRKLKKIWAIIRNKDFYYSDILMSREEFEKFKSYINQF